MARAIIAQFVITSTDIQCIGEFSCYWCNEIFKSKSSRSYILGHIYMSNFTGFDYSKY
jgi:hypothetical protein